MADIRLEAKGTIKTISIEPRQKTLADGSKKDYSVCTVEISEGPALGKVVFAGRTLGTSSLGKVKNEISLGQKVKIYGTIVPGKILWEISTGNDDVSDDNDVLAAFGITTAEVKADTIEMDVL